MNIICGGYGDIWDIWGYILDIWDYIRLIYYNNTYNNKMFKCGSCKASHTSKEALRVRISNGETVCKSCSKPESLWSCIVKDTVNYSIFEQELLFSQEKALPKKLSRAQYNALDESLSQANDYIKNLKRLKHEYEQDLCSNLLANKTIAECLHYYHYTLFDVTDPQNTTPIDMDGLDPGETGDEDVNADASDFSDWYTFIRENPQNFIVYASEHNGIMKWLGYKPYKFHSTECEAYKTFMVFNKSNHTWRLIECITEIVEKDGYNFNRHFTNVEDDITQKLKDKQIKV